VSADARVPVTVVTGALGAGKSTLLSRWLASGGERLALIVNELGDVPLDGLLIRRADEDLIELSNGCVCCTVRGDLVRTATELLRRRERWLRPARFDRIVIETSGLAAPGPVVQSFLIDPELAARTRPDGVIALVHAQHLARQLTEALELQTSSRVTPVRGPGKSVFTRGRAEKLGVRSQLRLPSRR